MSDEIVKFVHLVEENECLYKNNIQTYSNKSITEKAWVEIDQKMNWSVASCKEKWRNIRNGFVRSLKPSPSGSSSTEKKKYYLHDIMGFVLPYVKPVQHAEQTSNIKLPDLDDGLSEVVDTIGNMEESYDVALNCTEEPSITTGKKRNKKKLSDEPDEIDKAVLGYIQEKKGRKVEDDSRKMFLLSLLPDLNNLSDRQFRQFKLKTMIMVEDLLNEGQENAHQRLLQPQQSNSCSFVSTLASSPMDPPTSIISTATPENSIINTNDSDILKVYSPHSNGNPNTFHGVLNLQ